MKKTAAVSKECVACGVCVKECPLNAIFVHNGITAKVDIKKCVGCGKCVKACPAGVISIVKHSGEELVRDENKALV